MRQRISAWITQRWRYARQDDRGSVIETVIIAAGLAALAGCGNSRPVVLAFDRGMR